MCWAKLVLACSDYLTHYISITCNAVFVTFCRTFMALLPLLNPLLSVFAVVSLDHYYSTALRANVGHAASFGSGITICKNSAAHCLILLKYSSNSPVLNLVVLL